MTFDGRIPVILAFSAFLAATYPSARGQCPTWDPGFHGAGAFDEVRALATFDDGQGEKLYFAGKLLRVGTQSVSGLARTDGSVWETIGEVRFGAEPGEVDAIVVFDDGSGPKFFIGGRFDSVGGEPANNVARWDGTTWVRLGQGTSGGVRALHVFDDGSGPALYVGGYFPTGIGGTIATYGIGRWNGSSWSSVGGGLGFTGWWVKSLEVFDDGNGPALYAAGFFYSAGGTSVNHVARWDGTSWSALGGGLGSHQGYALVVHDDGLGSALYVSGDFNDVGGVPMDHVARWDGTSWSALASNPFGMPTVEILGLASLDLCLGTGTQLLALGSSAGTTDLLPAIAAWNGTAWSAVGSSLSGPADPFVRAAALFDDGSSSGSSLFVGGRFATAGGELSQSIARLRTCDLPGVAFCAGDGSTGACPCANTGLPGHGCENSSASGGALLEASGGALLVQDGLVLRASGELPSALSIFLQGSGEIVPVAFGDGLRCAGGNLKRLYVANASGGIVQAPLAGDAAISVRSAELGDPIASAEERFYQVYYRDPDASFCSAPVGNSWNVTNALRIAWH